MQKLNGLTFFKSNEDLVPQLGREIYIYRVEEGHIDKSFTLNSSEMEFGLV